MVAQINKIDTPVVGDLSSRDNAMRGTWRQND